MTLPAAEALAADIDHLKQALHAACDDLGDAQEELGGHEYGNVDGLPHPEGIGESMAALGHQVALEVDMTAEAALGHAMDAAEQTALRVLAHVQAGSDELGHAYVALDALLAGAAQRLAQAGHDTDTAQRAALEHAGAALDAAFETLRVALGEARTALQGELEAAGLEYREVQTALASQVLPAIDAALGSEHPALVANTALSARSGFDAAVTRLDDQVAAQASQFEGLGAQLRTQVCRQIDHCLDETLANLKHQIGERVAVHLSREVMQSVAEAQIGQQLTAAMAPILPEMAVIYKASEAIKTGIEIIRNPVGQLGGLIKI